MAAMESDDESGVQAQEGSDTDFDVDDSNVQTEETGTPATYGSNDASVVWETGPPESEWNNSNASLEEEAAEVTTQSVRRMLASLRGMWRNHSPTSPMCLCDERTPGGMTVSQFCFFLLLSQRNRRGVRAR